MIDVQLLTDRICPPENATTRYSATTRWPSSPPDIRYPATVALFDAFHAAGGHIIVAACHETESQWFAAAVPALQVVWLSTVSEYCTTTKALSVEIEPFFGKEQIDHRLQLLKCSSIFCAATHPALNLLRA